MTTKTESKSPLLDTKAAAAYLGVSPRTLEDWRHDGRGPRFVVLGRRVFYQREILDAYIEAQQARSTAEAKLLRVEYSLPVTTPQGFGARLVEFLGRRSFVAGHPAR